MSNLSSKAYLFYVGRHMTPTSLCLLVHQLTTALSRAPHCLGSWQLPYTRHPPWLPPVGDVHSGSLHTAHISPGSVATSAGPLHRTLRIRRTDSACPPDTGTESSSAGDHRAGVTCFLVVQLFLLQFRSGVALLGMAFLVCGRESWNGVGCHLNSSARWVGALSCALMVPQTKQAS